MKKFLRKVLRKDRLVKAGLVAGAVAATAGTAMAASAGGGGGTDTTFQGIADTISAWAQGTLAKAITIGTLLVGGGYAVATQSVRFAAVTAALALVMAYGPTIVDNILSGAVF